MGVTESSAVVDKGEGIKKLSEYCLCNQWTAPLNGINVFSRTCSTPAAFHEVMLRPN